MRISDWSSDVCSSDLSSTARDDDRDRWIAFNRSYNQILSAHEHSVLEDMFSTPTQPVLGVSTVKAIAVAAQQGQRIYTITQNNLATALSQLRLPAEVETHRSESRRVGKAGTVSLDSGGRRYLKQK